MVILYKITWGDFQKIIQVIKDYKNIAIERKPEDKLWFGKILDAFSKVKKQNRNIVVDDLKKEDLHKITITVDLWNVAADLIRNEEYNGVYDEISSKLQRAYFKNFNEQIFSEDEK